MKTFLTLCILIFFISSHAQTGKVGINTTSPAAMLHVKDSSVLFTGPFSVGPGAPPVSGSGIRMMWYPAKAAFRAGWVNGPHWNRDSIGDYSMGLGVNTVAKGTIAVALGHISRASGFASTAIGNVTVATAQASTAMGQATFAGGLASTAMGDETSATGAYSTAMGELTTASGDNSTALGNSTMASGLTSTAFGHSTLASGGYSTAMGYFTVASSTNAVAFGDRSKANGLSSAAFGRETIASGTYSVATGRGTKAKSSNSFVLGAFNDTTSTSSNSWILTDPLFIIGNGLTENSLSNAVTVLKNGNMGLGDNSPNARLHVSNGASANIYNGDADMIIEDDDDCYIQFSNPDLESAGLLSGRTTTSVRSGIIFQPDSSILFRSGGNTTRLTLDKNGNSSLTGNSTVSGEIRRTSTGTSNVVPICYGSISPGSPPVIQSGTGNFTVSNPAVGEYHITITGENYSNNGYTSLVTPVSSLFRTASIGASGNNLIVKLFNSAFAQVDNYFHFVVYKN